MKETQGHVEGLGIGGKKAGGHSSTLFTLTSPSTVALIASVLPTKDSAPKMKKNDWKIFKSR